VFSDELRGKQLSPYFAHDSRYQQMTYRRCGASGVQLPMISLGLWHNFGGADIYERGRVMLRRAFDLGITHFDLANNYGPPAGSAEETFGKILRDDLHPYRDELFISSKAGYYMWPGPYGEWGSRKNLIASVDQSLMRMGLEYVDIFYHHRPDPNTPLEETMRALDQIVRSGKALYVGLSNYSPEQTELAVAILAQLGTPCLIHQPSYSMLNRHIEKGLTQTLQKLAIGCIVFSPLHKGILTNRYLNGIASDTRAAGSSPFLKPSDISPEVMAKVRALDAMAAERGQSLAQMSLAWTLRDDVVTSSLIGASKVEQIEDAVGALANLAFTDTELARIDAILDATDASIPPPWRDLP